jgi:F0F1-type ATP synthase membrane subunit c/vacuolar-type H+-ATPase subunit K
VKTMKRFLGIIVWVISALLLPFSLLIADGVTDKGIIYLAAGLAVGLPGLGSGIGMGLFFLSRRRKRDETEEFKKETEQFDPRILAVLLLFTAPVIFGFVAAIFILTFVKQGGGI